MKVRVKSTTTFWVYLVECKDGTVYAGIACDVAARIEVHNQGTGAKYVRGRTPVRLLAETGPMDRGSALKLEAQIKRKRGRDAKLGLLLSAGRPAGD